ncbi:MAG: MAPEG family protein [Hyphomonadaceae bacterium]
MATVTPLERPRLWEYGLVAVIVGIAMVLIVQVTGPPGAPARAQDLVLPMCAMFALTAVVWILMAVVRNAVVLFGKASVAYFRDYRDADAPEEWIERPARNFNNLMQVPALFYVAALTIIVAGKPDMAQVGLAWIFVGFRLAHSIVHIAINYVPLRFALYASSCIVLAVMWFRLAFPGSA